MYQKAVASNDVEAVSLDIPGITIRTLHTDEVSGATTVMTHIEAGASIPEHWHTQADETVYVVSGDFVERGKSYGPGSFFVGKAGTSHGPHESRSGCTVLTTFSAPLDFQIGDPGSSLAPRPPITILQ
jgi:quercetin dioxygenase-like cupin family protein